MKIDFTLVVIVMVGIIVVGGFGWMLIEKIIEDRKEQKLDKESKKNAQIKDWL